MKESPPAASSSPIRVGVSACLLGREVRYDGQHKRDDFVSEALAAFVELVPVCPEVEAGMGIPREPVRLQKRGADTRFVTVQTGNDLTAMMQAFAAKRVRALAKEDLRGYILKKDSPSCGMERVKRYRSEAGAPPDRDGTGLFAAALLAAFPNLPIEEEGRLKDPGLRENFVERIFAYHRWRAFAAAPFTVEGLAAFHAAHKLTLLAHSPAACRMLGKLVAEASRVPRAALLERYEAGFMAALKKLATPSDRYRAPVRPRQRRPSAATTRPPVPR